MLPVTPASEIKTDLDFFIGVANMVAFEVAAFGGFFVVLKIASFAQLLL